MTKLCRKCNKSKLFTEFTKNNKCKDGLYAYCKDCARNNRKLYYKTANGKTILKKAFQKIVDSGYYIFGKGAISNLKQTSKKRGMPFDLTVEVLKNWWDSQPNTCYYCGKTIEEYLLLKDYIINYNSNKYGIKKFKRFYRSSKHKNFKRMTIDRLDNSVGYTISNIVKSCWICNSLKNDFFDSADIKLIAPKIILKLEVELSKTNTKEDFINKELMETPLKIPKFELKIIPLKLC